MAFILNMLIMKKITFAEKNSLIVKHHGKKYFYKDLELFKKYFPSHELNTELANANQFSIERLDGQMLNELLGIIGIEEILDNRQEKEPEPMPEPPEVKTIDNVKALLIAEFAFTDKDFEIIGEDYLQFLTSKDNEAIKVAVQRFVALHPETKDDNDNEGSDNGNDGDNDNTASADAAAGIILEEKAEGDVLIDAADSIPPVAAVVESPVASDKKKEAKAKNSQK